MLRQSAPAAAARRSAALCRAAPHSSALAPARARGASRVCAAGPSQGPGEEEPPVPWDEEGRGRVVRLELPGVPPFVVYLLSSTIVAIAATGSAFEFAAKNPIFGVLPADNPLYTPILGLFVLTGFPTSAVLFGKCIQAANEASANADKQDGY